MRTGPDWLALVAGTIALLMTAAYVAIMAHQGDPPLVVVLVLLLGCAGLCLYGSRRSAPQRGAALLVAGTGLTGLGLLAILTIGLPILLAGVIALRAGIRTGYELR